MVRPTINSLLALVLLTFGAAPASASIITPSTFHARIDGFTLYADGDFLLPDDAGVTVGGIVFATLTPTTVQVGLTQTNFANFQQVFTFDLTNLQLPAGQVISGLTVIANNRTCCSTSTSFTDNSIQVRFTGTDVRLGPDTITYQIDFTPADGSVPEPAAFALVGTALAVFLRRRSKR